jgi:predicted PurR-regulated permease PerM
MLLMVVTIGFIIPLIIDGVKELNYIITNYDTILNNKVIPFIEPMLPAGYDISSLSEAVKAQSGVITEHATAWLKTAALSTMKVFDLVSIFLITPLALFYLLRDWDKMLEILHTLIPEDEQNYVSVVLKRMDEKLSSFVRGQLLVCLFLGSFYAIGLSLVGLKLGFLIGFLTGLLSFIPFVGMLLGVVASLVVALLQFPLTDVQPFIMIGGVFLVGQVLEGSVISPKLVGDALGLHPLWIVFAVMAGGELGGFMGILIALPVSAIVTVIVLEVINHYKKSSIYAKKKKAVSKKAKPKTKKQEA